MDNDKQYDIDLDEIEDLPDVVLGEKTRAMRVIRERELLQGNHEATQETQMIETIHDDIVEEQQTISDEDSLSEEEVEQAVEDADQINEIVETSTKEAEVSSESDEPSVNSDSDTEENSIDTSSDNFDTSNVSDDSVDSTDDIQTSDESETIVEDIKNNEDANEDASDDTNVSESNAVIQDSDEVADESRGEDDEIPTSVTDDDPGVNDELSEVYAEKEKHDITDPLPKAKDELSSIYENEEPNHKSAENPVYFEQTEQVNESSNFNPPKPKKKRKRVPLFRRFVQFLLVVLLVLFGYGVWHAYDALQPVQSESEQLYFEVNEGETLSDVTNALEEAGVIKDSQIAYYYIRYKNLTDLKMGIYEIDKSWTLDEIFTALNDESLATRNAAIVTIIEGDWAKDIAKKMASVTNVTAEELLALWHNREWIESQKETYPFITDEMFQDNVRVYLEGYLAPDTYQVPSETTAEEITKMLLDQTLAVYNKYEDDIAASDYSIHQIYTMASIIQYEAGSKEDDLKNIAGVFYNRLKIDMKLESSVTVCYAIDFDKEVDNWTACEVNPDYDNPYNTYMYAGLTPGAINNPGAMAIEAAIYPTENSYYYFMADVYGDGTVYYAETLEEHEANVAKYLY